MYRVVQESLNNVVRHARAASGEVEVLAAENEVRITVRDNGTGFDPLATSGGFGLTGMRERISLAGGELNITSGPEGTRIEAKLPALPSVRRTA